MTIKLKHVELTFKSHQVLSITELFPWIFGKICENNVFKREGDVMPIRYPDDYVKLPMLATPEDGQYLGVRFCQLSGGDSVGELRQPEACQRDLLAASSSEDAVPK